MGDLAAAAGKTGMGALYGATVAAPIGLAVGGAVGLLHHVLSKNKNKRGLLSSVLTGAGAGTAASMGFGALATGGLAARSAIQDYNAEG